jgi:cytochrome P450
MRPVLPGFIPRIAPPSGITYDGISIPAGVSSQSLTFEAVDISNQECMQTMVTTSQLSVFRDEQIFTQAYKFKPERWMDPDSKDLDEWFVTFSRGPRNCPARQ